MDKKTLKAITAILGGEEGKDNEELITALTTDQTDIKDLGDKVATLETTAQTFEGIDAVQAKAFSEVLNANGLDTTDKIINMVKGGEASEEEKTSLKNRITELTSQNEKIIVDASNEALRKDAKALLMDKATYGKAMPADFITKALFDGESLRKENDTIQIKDANGNWFGADSKEALTFIESSYADINPKPNNGTTLNNDTTAPSGEKTDTQYNWTPRK